MAEPTSCCAVPGTYCARVDALFNVPGVHLIDVGRRDDRLQVEVETGPAAMDCPRCGVVAESNGRRNRLLHDIPAFGAPVELTWRVRRWRCVKTDCPVAVFTEAHGLAPPREKLTSRAAWWAVSIMHKDTASVAALARRLGES
jgi:transposase